MLPPIDESVLKNNPDFANLYKSLTGLVLNTDGSTKNDGRAKKRVQVQNELRDHRLRATKKHLLRQALATVETPSDEPVKQHRRTKSQIQGPLPPDLLELISLIPAVLNEARNMSSPDLKLLLSTPPFSQYPELLPQLAVVVSSHLTTQASALARILNPNTNPSFIHRNIPSMPTTTLAVLENISSSQAKLSSSRLTATASLLTYLDQQTAALTVLVRAIEAKHGLVSRSAELRSEDASLTAQAWASTLRELLCETRELVYPAEARKALLNYKRHLVNAKVGVKDSIRVKQAELGDYGVFITDDDGALGIGHGDENRERTMREMARVWKEMDGRLAGVKADLARLERS